jgi:4-diphosphocytidyl-2-C-methyl-D-erythritol kinase
VSDPLARLTPVVRLAPAKLNLTLAVLGRRRDGFHDLHSVMVPLALADRLSLAVAAPERDARANAERGTGDTLHVEGLDAGPPADNLALRAVGEARLAVGGGWPGGPGPTPPLSLRLEKRIPVAAGLGGGSSDAAAALDGALEAWDAELDSERRRVVAAWLGSDVPFFLVGGAALVEGRGERVEPLRGVLGGPGVLLVTPAVALPTPAVFAAVAERGSRGDGSVRMTSEHLAGEIGAGIRADDLLARAGVLAAANDLLPAAAAALPGLVAFRRALFRVLGRPVGLSGSGPTLWTLYPSEDDAAAAAVAVRDALAAGAIPILGDGTPAILATSILEGATR